MEFGSWPAGRPGPAGQEPNSMHSGTLRGGGWSRGDRRRSRRTSFSVPKGPFCRQSAQVQTLTMAWNMKTWF